MCKILAMSGITLETKDKAWEFIHKVTKEMSRTDDDGFGYMAIGDNGLMFGERWHKNNDAFLNRNSLTEEEREIIQLYPDAFVASESYNIFGNHNMNIRSVALHARKATSGKEFYNTHPFIEDHTGLIHNGIIHNVKQLKQKYSTCDSETILHEYIQLDIANHPEKIQKLVKRLDGWFACAVMSKLTDGTPILDIFKDRQTSLSAIEIKELKTVVFSTSEWNVTSACRDLNLTVGAKFTVKPGRLIRMNALTGQVINVWRFTVKESSWQDTWQGHHAESSIIPSTKVIGSHMTKKNVRNWDFDEQNKVWKFKSGK